MKEDASMMLFEPTVRTWRSLFPRIAQDTKKIIWPFQKSWAVVHHPDGLDPAAVHLAASFSKRKSAVDFVSASQKMHH